MAAPSNNSASDPHVWNSLGHEENPSLRVINTVTKPTASQAESSFAVPSPQQTEDDQDLARATLNSAKDQGQASSCGSSFDNPSKMAHTSSETWIELLVENLALRMSNEFPTLHDPSGDTLIYLGPPSKLRHHTMDDYAHIKKHFHRIIQVDSSALKALGSKKFGIGEGQLLGPGACIRAKRRFKKLDIYNKIDQGLLDRIKYHVDLRPPSEDDEAVLLLTDLTCTRGVRTWYRAKGKYRLSANLVLGTDELDTSSNQYSVVSGDRTGKENGKTAGASNGVEADSFMDLSVSELCPLRQHSAIERMLRAIYGNDPKLDSAPKVWAFFVTANYYDCAHHPSISKWIETWLYTEKNVSFIQNNPEVIYRIGMGCRLEHLTKDAFSILVGEKALLDVASELSGQVPSSKRSIHGREFENLDDDERNRISHAASSLIRRVRALYQSILIDHDWLKDCVHYNRLLLLEPESDDEKDVIETATLLIRQFCANRIKSMVSRDLRMPFSDLDPSASNTSAFRNGHVPDFESTYNNLRAEARPLVRSFWMALHRIQLTDGDSSNSVADIPELALPGQAQLMTGSPVIQKVQVHTALNRVNEILRSRYHRELGESNPGSVSPRATTTELSSTLKPQAQAHYKSPGSRQILPFRPMKNRVSEEQTQDIFLQSGESHCSPKRPSEAIIAPGESLGKRRRTLDSSEQERPIAASVIDEKGETPLVQNPHADSTSAPKNVGIFEDDTLFWKDLQFYDRHAAQASGLPVREPWFVREPARQKWAMFPSHPKPTIAGSDESPKPQLSDYELHKDGETGQSEFRMKPDVVKVYSGGHASSSQWRDQGWVANPPLMNPYKPTPTNNASMHVQFDDATPALAPTSRRKVLQQFSDTEPLAQRDLAEQEQGGWQFVGGGSPPHLEYFNVVAMLSQMSRVLSRKCDEIVYPPHLFHGTQQTPIDLIDTLLCLEEDEWKFLPLWAGGYDDGEGGVFNEVDVPNDDAAGFKGGKRGINSVANGGAGSVSASEDSFDDVAEEAVSTIGKASKFATDGTATVKSVSESGSISDDGFMNQDEAYAVVQAMSMEKMEKGKGKGKQGDVWTPADEYDFDDDEMPLNDDDDGDVSTVMGAGSDIQGQFFGGDMNDGDDDLAYENDDDEDMEIIDQNEL